MKSNIQKGILAVCTILLFLCCSKSNSDPSYGNTPPPSGGNNNGNNVSIDNMSFGPSSITVTKGTTVIWTNNAYTTHTVTADDNSFNSGNLSYGGTFSYKFNNTGTFNYHCSIHSGMTGSVVVK
jgi:plastocyanin